MLEGYTDLLINVSILFGLGSVYIVLPFKDHTNPIWLRVVSGVLIGGLTLIVMNAQFVVTDGFLLDTRSILLSTSTAFLGPVVGFIAASMAAGLRILQGGTGAFTGVVVIYITTLIGFVFRKYRVQNLKLRSFRSFIELYIFGFITHIVMLLCFFILPYEMATYVLEIITLPVLILYPILTVLLGIILLVQRTSIENTKKIEHISNHDYLTGFYNRLYLEKIFKKYKKETSTGVIMGDVNGLKVFNDSYGHLVGDELLILISRIIDSMSPDKSLLVRWGGDEFVIVLPKTDLIELNQVCLDINHECANHIIKDVHPSIALGYSITEDGDFEKAFSEAEDLMYRNKLSEGASMRSSLISSLENTLIERKYETEHHSNNMADLAVKIAERVGLSTNELDELVLIAKLHDIGKIGISESILLKPSRLTDEEFKEIKRHPQIGFRILESISELKHIAHSVLCHHEKWDGTGYPQGLKKDEIPLLSRIITLVDAYEAMTSGRIYQKAKTKEKAIEELVRCSGTQFDPYLVDIFIEII